MALSFDQDAGSVNFRQLPQIENSFNTSLLLDLKINPENTPGNTPDNNPKITPTDSEEQPHARIDQHGLKDVTLTSETENPLSETFSLR